MPSRTQPLPDGGARQTSAGRLMQRLSDERFLFVLVSIVTNVLMIGRSYVAMLTLDDRGLGTITLLQTLILFVSTLQLGMLQGGYRLLCNGEGEDREGINNLLYALLAGLGAILILGSLVAIPLADSKMVAAIAICGAATGVITLNRTWINNQLIALGALTQLNRLTLWTALVAMLPLLAVPVAPLGAMIASLVVQPLLFVILALVRRKDLRPTRLRFDRGLAARILAAGFALFLTSLCVQSNILVERWYVTSSLGLEALGQLFLMTLFITLFQLIPNALDSIYLPRLVTVYKADDTIGIRRILRNFLLLLVTFCAIATAVTLLLAKPILLWLLPQRADDLRYVYLVLPGLVLFTLSGPFAMMFNALIDYRAYYAAYGVAAFGTIVSFAMATVIPVYLDLDKVMIIRSSFYMLTGSILFVSFIILSKKHKEFRFLST